MSVREILQVFVRNNPIHLIMNRLELWFCVQFDLTTVYCKHHPPDEFYCFKRVRSGKNGDNFSSKLRVMTCHW